MPLRDRQGCCYVTDRNANRGILSVTMSMPFGLQSGDVFLVSVALGTVTIMTKFLFPSRRMVAHISLPCMLICHPPSVPHAYCILCQNSVHTAMCANFCTSLDPYPSHLLYFTGDSHHLAANIDCNHCYYCLSSVLPWHTRYTSLN